MVSGRLPSLCLDRWWGGARGPPGWPEGDGQPQASGPKEGGLYSRPHGAQHPSPMVAHCHMKSPLP